MPLWLRVLGWSLVASLLLHWVALDLLRGQGGVARPGDTGRVPLQVVPGGLTEPATKPPETQLASSSISIASSRVAPGLVGARDVSVAPPEQQDDPVRLLPAPRVAQEPRPDSAEPSGLPGVRSGAFEEALLALRILLAEGMSRDLQVGRSVLEFDASGRLVEVDGQAMPPGVQARLAGLVARHGLPEALRGRAFVVELLLE